LESVCIHNYVPATIYAGGVTKNPQRKRNPRQSRPPRSADETRWADLADLALVVGRELQYRGYSHDQALSLTQSEGMVMRHLLQGDPAAPSQIAAATGLQRTNLSTTLRGLEHKGLIQRKANPSDGRGVTVTATERGRTNYALVRHEWVSAVATAAGHDTTHLDTALTLLTTVKEGLIKTRPRTPAGDQPT
jgi:DNA-binding MarR family transcriptional regulator